MKRIIFVALLSGLSALSAQASNNIADNPAEQNSQAINSQVLKDNNLRNSLWMESSNAAGLAFRPFKMYKELDISYDLELGQFRQAQDAGKSQNVSLNTVGSAYLGKFIVWGKFSFKNIFEKERNMNVLMYEVETDMPYYPIDTTKNSGWTKQEYDLQAKLSSPVLWDRVSFGVDINYNNKVGAKNLDPRSETYKYHININPAVAVRLGKHFIGINAIYRNQSERSDPRNMNGWVSQTVYLHKGVGESIRGKVGDNDGLKDYIFKANKYGAGLQYGVSGSSELLADFSYTILKSDVISSPDLPKNEGSTKRTDITGKVELLFGNNNSNNLWVEGLYRKTAGTEYVTKITTVSATEQYWEVLSSNVMSKYSLMTASIGYDHQFGASDPKGFDWIVGAQADFMMRSDKYLLPESKFNATTAFAKVFGGKQFKFRASSLLIKIDGGYSIALGSKYVYGGTKGTYQPVEMYKADCDYFNTNYVKAGGNVAYTINSKKVGFILKAKADYIKPLGMKNDRLYANASFGIVF